MKAKAAIVFEVRKKLDLREVEVEPPRSGELLIKMAAAGICHSDLHVMTGHLAAQLPAILGHEGSGIVAITPVPEPETILLTASGLISLTSLAALRKKFKRSLVAMHQN